MGVLQNKHLIGLEHTPTEDIHKLIDTSFTFREVLDRPIKKVPSLMGKMLSIYSLKTPPVHVFHLSLLKNDYQQILLISLLVLPV